MGRVRVSSSRRHRSEEAVDVQDVYVERPTIRQWNSSSTFLSGSLTRTARRRPASCCSCIDGGRVCGVYTHEVAETKVTHVMDFARQHQHPLQCTLEKD